MAHELLSAEYLEEARVGIGIGIIISKGVVALGEVTSTILYSILHDYLHN